MLCRICTTPSRTTAKAIILGKHTVQYFQCPTCGFVQTEEPYWLDEAYSTAITKSDIGMAGRSVSSARITKAIIHSFFRGSGKFLDYGGGYGLMVRLLRDAGFDYYRNDKFCENIFAQGFDVDMPQEDKPPYELATAFEVFEHLVDPVQEVGQLLRFSRNVLLSTTLLPALPPQPTDWWYYGIEHGQHVSLYTLKSLTLLARRFELNCYSDGQSLHLLTEKRLSNAYFRFVARHSTLLSLFFTVAQQRKSLLPSDFHALTGQALR